MSPLMLGDEIRTFFYTPISPQKQIICLRCMQGTGGGDGVWGIHNNSILIWTKISDKSELRHSL